MRRARDERVKKHICEFDVERVARKPSGAKAWLRLAALVLTLHGPTPWSSAPLPIPTSMNSLCGGRRTIGVGKTGQEASRRLLDSHQPYAHGAGADGAEQAGRLVLAVPSD